MVRNTLKKDDEMIIHAPKMDSSMEEAQTKFYELINNCFLFAGVSCSIIVVLTFLFK
ncbi:hypothetical protein [Lottiidibacillus patelloidae]|uniref:hypothetical protein n=1 Tax=Lottiidibacillus patelloidae TaxID=2670334 RepID=UPI0013035411|nr:hypothetical protein [Lottiidibacillus patelloidae]